MSSHRPQKKWGQNFLRNPSAVEKIVEAIGAAPEELILEIGPGEGALTSRLARLPNRIHALEIDPSLAARLAGRFEGANVTIENADATSAALPDEPFRAVGNLPYNVGTPIMRRVIASPCCRSAVFMLQKEVADRVLASAGDEDYGYLSIYVALYARARLVMTLNPGSFYPRPKVHSAVIALETAPPETAATREEILELASASFRMRRKKLSNNLAPYRGIGKERAVEAIESAGLSPDVRAEELSISQFDAIAKALRESP